MAHVLVLTHQRILRKAIEATLRADRHAVTLADDGWQALAVLRASLHPLIFVLASDEFEPPFLDPALVGHLTEQPYLVREHAWLELRAFHRSGVGLREESCPLVRLGVDAFAMPFTMDDVREWVMGATEGLTARG